VKYKLRKIGEQVVVVTGASSGIGRTTARMAAERGASVVLAARDEEDLREAANEIRAMGRDAMDVVCDVRDMEAVRRVADLAVQTYGRIDTWVNNAGVSIYGRTLHIPVDDARQVFETNYWGVVHGSLVAVDRLRDAGGALINMGSVSSDRAIPLQGHYSASKHAVAAFTDALRLELEKDGIPIAVTLVKPAPVDTPYPHHARAYLEREPKLPPPVYAPEAVARAILHCAAHPERDVVVGGGGRILTALGAVAPRLVDRYMEATMFDQQMGEQAIAPARRRDALDAPLAGDAAERGDQPGHVLRSSAYTQARLHPVATVAASLVGLATVAGARRWLRH
jgi:short-subunit dehydrogenase